MKKWMLWVLTLGVAVSAVAQGAASPAAAPAIETTSHWFRDGGPLMYPLAILSVLGVTMILYFSFTMREEQILPRKFVVNLRELLAAGRFVEAQAVCRSNSSAISAITSVALEHRLRSNRPDPIVIGEIVEGEGGRQATLIQNKIQYLADVGGIAPMMGLLGTVLGMLNAFSGLAYDVAKAKPVVLAAGVSQALITTVAGLIVAIPAMVAYSYFRGRMARVIANLETSAADLTSLLTLER